MADGISLTDIPLSSSLDEVIGNVTESGILRTRRQSVGDLATQIAGSASMQDAFAAALAVETEARQAADADEAAARAAGDEALDARVDTVEATVASGIKPDKQSVRLLVTTATDPATMTAGSALDGLTLVANDRVARATPAGAAADGVYIVQVAGAAIRAADMDAADELPGSRFQVDAGTHASETWTLQTPSPIVVNTTVLLFAKTGSANSTTAEVIAGRGGKASLDARFDDIETDVASEKFLSGLPVPAVQLTEGTVSNTQHTFSKPSGAMTIGQVYSLTAVFKPGSNRSIQLAALVGTLFTASVDPVTLAVTTTGTLNSAVASRRGDWITLTVTWTEASATSRSLYVRLLNAVASVTYVGDGASHVSLSSFKLTNVTTASTIWTVTTAAGGTSSQLTATDVLTAEDLLANRFIATEDAVTGLDVKLNGQATMAKLAEAVGTVTPSLGRSISVTAGLTARFEAIVKLAAGDRRFGFSSVLSGGSMSAIFDLQDGVVETVASNCTATITHLGNDIYRCTLERVAVNTFSAAVQLQIWPVFGGPTRSDGDGVSGIYVQEFAFIRDGITILRTTDFSTATGGWTETDIIVTNNQALYLDLEAPVRQITSINRKLIPSPRVMWWGDSLSEGSGSTGGQTPGVQLRTLLGRQVAVAGAGSQQSAMIAARAGGRAALITVAGDQIPASGPVNITAYSVDIAYYAGNSYSVVGSLAGIPGTITKVTASGGSSSVVSYTFTRTTAGSAKRCLPDTPFIPSVVIPNRIQVIWIGRNDYGGLVGTPAFEAANTTIKDCIKSIINTITTLEKRAIILGVLPSNSAAEYVGTDSFNYKRLLARDLARDYPNGFIDIDPILRSNGDGSAGDNTDIANGVTPGSKRSDGTHLNNAGYGIVAAEIKARIDQNVW